MSSGGFDGAGGLHAANGRRVIVWRHGRTPWNAAGRFQGQTDIDLDEVGEAQAESSARLLAALDPDLIVASDLTRARKTGEALGRVTGLPVTLDERLRETNAGRWQGLTFAEINEQFPEESAAWSTGDVDVAPGGGESRLDVAARVCAAIEEHLEALPDDGLLVLATHGGAARVAIASLLGLPHGSWSVLSGLANCNWSMVEEMGADKAARGLRWRLAEHNAGSLPEPVVVEEG
ncbi:histidine phosphatase family protein [Tersicoccus sp. Bi-70]|uniref:histidine phosphatase family protein n=1 Tax=Tersicoccus sp. Bi-70 TaxID=1897634 RepID=UPI000977244E|nr:histidine phosphatase family protein [Tersicoccus sp. Bi-70]OMH36835.1 hypothetical protein BGP79_13845 [Tersicoccus sp. Bi-70]